MLGQIANHLPRPSSLDCGQASTSGRCIPNVVSRTHRRRHAFSGQSIGTARLDVAAAAKKAGRPPSVQPDQPAAIEEPPAAGKKGRKRGRKPASETVVEGPPTVLEKGAPSVPLPGEFQQTLIRSFTLGGIGLHTGEYAVVKVKPAYAGEGRYFVRVPEGTNKDDFKPEEEVEVDLEDAGRPYERDDELEEQKIILFKQYLVAQDVEGFDGSFEQYLHHVDARELIERAEAGEDVSAAEYSFDEPEPIQARGANEVVVPASLDSIVSPQPVTLVLGDATKQENTVVGAEDLLAALEACGVNNARIEIEGGCEVPVLDGSALGWAMEIQFAGVRTAPQRNGSTEGVRRHALQVDQPLTVTDGDSFITFVPEQLTRVTCGVNYSNEAPVLGKQWASWCQDEDLPFRFEIGPARRYAAHPEEVVQMAGAGYFRGGADGVMIIAVDDKWYDATLLRFPRDEAARREMVVTVGCAALQATPGNSGLPTGHIIAYKPTLDLRIQFLRALRDAATAAWLPVQDITAAQAAQAATEEPEAEAGDEEEEE